MMWQEAGMGGRRKTAGCLAVGSELLGERRLDSNSLTITHALARYGVTVEEKRVVGDSVERLAIAIRELLDRHDLVVVTGGLGPRGGSAPATPSSVGRCPRSARRWRGLSRAPHHFATTAALPPA
jgi:hypothetical protein